MAMQSNKTREKMTDFSKGDKKKLVKIEQPNHDVPDYLKDAKITGLEGLNSDDYVMPRLALVQSKTKLYEQDPTSFRIGDYYHSISKRDLGEEVNAVICVARKSVVLRAPFSSKQGILARSRDCIHWDRPNANFKVQLDKIGEVTWSTKKNVLDSGLLEFGSYFPGNPKSPPAAQLTYEYIVYLIDYPELSPCALFMKKKETQVAKAMNTALRITRRPIQAIRMILGSQPIPFGDGNYYIPSFGLDGYVPHAVYLECMNLAESYKNIEVMTEQDFEEPHNTAEEIDDVIPFDK